jgi:GTP-binding protein
MFFDCSQRIAKVDKQLCNYIEDAYKPCIFVVNKWDKMSAHMPTERWGEYLRENFATMSYVPIAFITGQDGRNVRKLLNHAQMLFKQSRARVTTGELNRLVRRALEQQAPPAAAGRRPKIYFATQVGTQPPTLVLKCNDPDLFPTTYRRYLLNVLRDELVFGEVPIRLILEQRAQVEGRTEKPEEDLSLEDRYDDLVGWDFSDQPEGPDR